MIFKHFKSLIIDLFFAAYRIHTSETFKIAIDKVGGYELETQRHNSSQSKCTGYIQMEQMTCWFGLKSQNLAGNIQSQNISLFRLKMTLSKILKDI